MLNRINGRQELDRVNMLIRALSVEIEEERAHVESASPTALLMEMKEAMYELRLRKFLFSALDSERITDNTTSH